MVDHLDYLVSAAALILFDQESPSPHWHSVLGFVYQHAR